MRFGRIVLLLALAAIGAVEVIGYRGYRSDMAAWRRVQRSLTTLHSRLEREPASRLAGPMKSARAAVESFAASAHRFPRDQRERLRAAQRGLSYLDISVGGAQNIRNWEAMAAYTDVSKVLPRGCDGDHLAFSPALISEAFAVAGSYLINEAITGTAGRNSSNWREGFYPPLDLAKETASCQRLARAKLRMADIKTATTPEHSARWRYHVEVVNPTGCLMTPYSDDEPIPVPHARVYRFHLDANRNVRLEQVFCNAKKPGEAISVSVNGQTYDPVWLLDGSGINYAAQVVPRTALAMTPGGERN